MLKLLREYISTLLTEAKSDQLKLRFPHLESEIDELIAGGVETKYLDWAVKQLGRGSNPEELVDALGQFHKNAQRIKNKDINSYGDLESLRSTVDSLGMSKRRVSKEVLMKGSERIGETDEYKIYYVDDIGASKKLGSGTKWCISGDDASHHFWEYYFAGSRFYFCISKTETIETDPKYYKIAITVIGNKLEIFDAQDNRLTPGDVEDLVDISLADYSTKNRIKIANIERIVKHDSVDVRRRFTRTTSSEILQYLPLMIDDPDVVVRKMVARKIDPECLPQMMDDDEVDVLFIVAQRIDQKRLPQMMDDPDEYVRGEVARRIDPEYLPQMIDDPSESVRSTVARIIDPEYLPQMMDDPSDDVLRYVITRIDDKFLSKLKKSNNSTVRSVVARRIDPKHLPQMMDDPSDAVKVGVANRIDPKHLPQMIDDPSDAVRMEVARRIDPKHLPQMTDDPSGGVQLTVALRIDPEYLPQMIGSPFDSVRIEVSKKIETKYLIQMINDKNYGLRQIVVKRIDPEHLPQMLDDPKSAIRKMVQTRLKELGLL